MDGLTPRPHRPRRGGRPWIVKLGGSLAQSLVLAIWLDALAAGGGRAVIVPGGGPFADQVRAAQRRWRFDDAVAHRLALLAMEQYGLMLAGLRPQALRPAASRAEIDRIRGAGLVPVWLPTRMALGRPEIPESWDVTSDSLAAWLAGALDAERLVLIKAVETPPDGLAATELARRGIVDPLFPDFLSRCEADCRCVGAGRQAELADALRSGTVTGARIARPSGDVTLCASRSGYRDERRESESHTDVEEGPTEGRCAAKDLRTPRAAREVCARQPGGRKP